MSGADTNQMDGTRMHEDSGRCYREIRCVVVLYSSLGNILYRWVGISGGSVYKQLMMTLTTGGYIM